MAAMWWKGIACNTQLLKLAARIVSLIPSSASIKQNRLTNERAEKIVFIAHISKMERDRNMSMTDVKTSLTMSTTEKQVHILFLSR